MTLRFERGVPFLQAISSFWMLRQWDWTRETLNMELHPAFQGAFYCERCLPPKTEVYAQGYPHKACSVCGVIGLCARAARATVH